MRPPIDRSNFWKQTRKGEKAVLERRRKRGLRITRRCPHQSAPASRSNQRSAIPMRGSRRGLTARAQPPPWLAASYPPPPTRGGVKDRRGCRGRLFQALLISPPPAVAIAGPSTSGRSRCNFSRGFSPVRRERRTKRKCGERDDLGSLANKSNTNNVIDSTFSRIAPPEPPRRAG